MIISRETFRDGRWWITGSVLAVAAAHVAYRWDAARCVAGPSGGSAVGLTCGIVGTLMIVLAMLLIARKTWRTARIGSAYAWLQAHVWIGLMSYPIIWYHAGWRWGGPLTTALMVLFTAVWVTGILGLLLQNLVPQWLFHLVPQETVYGQIDKVARENLKAARKLVRSRMLVLRGGDDDMRGGVAIAAAPSDPAAALLTFYECQVRPYLAYGLSPGPASFWKPLRSSRAGWLRGTHRRRPPVPSASTFGRMRIQYPRLFDALNILQDFVEQRKRQRLQRRLHWALHGWLLLHVPCSVAMVVLIPLHAVLALRY